MSGPTIGTPGTTVVRPPGGSGSLHRRGALAASAAAVLAVVAVVFALEDAPPAPPPAPAGSVHAGTGPGAHH